MFSFVFKISYKRQRTYKVIINGHEINCPKSNAESISPKIKRHIISNKDLNEDNDNNSFSITIPEFENSFICSDSDYQYFEDIFNTIPVNISLITKDFLKIFAREFEIEELSSMIKMFEQSYELITEDHFLQLQKELHERMTNISEDNYEELIDHLCEIKAEYDEINNDFLYNIILTTCLVRSQKIELLMKFLREFEEKTNGDSFKYFKELILTDLKDNPNSNEMRFIVRYLYSIKEISEEKIKLTLTTKTGKFDDILYEKENEKILNNISVENPDFNIMYNIFGQYSMIDDRNVFNNDFLTEYATKGSHPSSIYQSIINDDLDSFSQLINENQDTSKLNDSFYSIIYERNTDLFGIEYNYLDLCAFYGSEKIFNFILMNDKEIQQTIEAQTVIFAVSGGNSSIIHKCVEAVQMDPFIIYKCILKSIQYNRNEVFEWLVETYGLFKKGTDLYQTLSRFKFVMKEGNNVLEYSIQFNNFETLFYLFSLGIDYQPIFSISMLYNNFYLANLALKLPYDCNVSSKKVQVNNYSPFSYNPKNIFFFGIF